MSNYFRFLALLLSASMYAAPASAQQDAPAPSTSDVDDTQAQPDQEVEVNEDNYRQFMELKDGLQQRTIAPEESFQSRSGQQKLDNLPEASQKHLRNQLREIISKGDRWQPGDENIEYPYVPSEAARSSRQLQNQEAGAWSELLDNYNAREAQIHANSARSSAALAGSGAAMGGGDGESGEQDRSGQGRQGSEESTSQADGEADSFAPGAQGGAEAQGAEGTAQNAMEFLQKAGYQAGNADAGASPQQSGDNAQASGQPQQDAQQDTARAQAGAQDPAANPGAQNAAEAQNPEGSEQNAMQYLQQLGQQQDGGAESGTQQAGEGSETNADNGQERISATMTETPGAAGSVSATYEPEGVSQNALEYLSGENTPAGDTQTDTLSLEDLLNAQGVSAGAGEQPEPEEPPDDPPD